MKKYNLSKITIVLILSLNLGLTPAFSANYDTGRDGYIGIDENGNYLATGCAVVILPVLKT